MQNRKQFIITLLVIVLGWGIFQGASYAETLEAANSGLLIISEILCGESGMSVSEEEVKGLAGLQRGRISFFGIKSALEKKGFTVEGYKVDLSTLESFLSRGTVVTVINKGSHFVTVLEVSESYVEIRDPVLGSEPFQYSLDIFKSDWDGKILLVKAKETTSLTQKSTALSEKTMAAGLNSATDGSVQALSEAEMQAEQTTLPCRNTLLDSGLPWWLKLLLTADPVVIANGNLSSEETDFLIQTKGLVPLELKRTYNSQSPAILDNWKPELGAGPWRIVNGEYCGHGDRSVSTFQNGGYTLTARMRTITAGTNEPWMTARVNFNYLSPNSTYYVLIGTNHKVELGRVIDGQYYVISHDTTLSPDNWNTVKIVSDANYTKVYLNGSTTPEFNVATAPQLRSGHVALEACFSHCHFDDVVLTPNGGTPIISDFNTRDREEPFGIGWTHTYGMRIEQVPGGVMVIMPDDRRPVFMGPPVGGNYISPRGIYDTLSVDASGYTLTEKDGTRYVFDTTGRLSYTEDRFGNRNTLYYEGDLLKRVTDPSDRSLTFDYEPDGKISAVTDPKGCKYQYFYEENQLVEVIDPKGNSKYYEYDPVEEVRTKYIDRKGNIYEYTYTYNLKVATQKDPDQNITTFGYYWATTHVTNRDNELWMYTIYEDSLMQREIKDNLGASTTYYWTPDPQHAGQYLPELEHTDDQYDRKNYYQYDAKGNRTYVKDPMNNVTEFTYEPVYNQVSTKKDARANVTRYIYDAGKLIRIEEPLAKTTAMEYYDYGKLKKTTDANGNITEYEYDTNGYTSKIRYYTETGIIEKNFTYDVIGNLLGETDEEGNITNYVYDANNNLLQVKDSAGSVLTSYTYDDNDNLVSVTDALGHTVYQEYDWAGNLIKKTEYDELNAAYTTEYTYDNVDYLHLGKSRLVSVKDAEGNITDYQYANIPYDGTLKTITDAENRQTKYKYDMVGNMIYIDDPAGKRTIYQYQNNDKIWKITYPDGTSEEFFYTPVGDLDNKRDRKWQTTRFEYDELNRMRFKRYPAGNVEYQYDNLNLKTVIDSNGTTTFNYDKLNRLVNATSPGAKTVSYEYYNNGLRKKLTYPDNTYITYSYDTLKRLTNIKDLAGSALASYAYDGKSGRRKGLTYNSGASIEYAYDVLNRIKSLKNKASGGSLFTSFSYTYDKAGNRLTMTSKEGLHKYYYDDTYQLIDVTYPDQRTGHYEYDVMGNRIYVDEKGEALDYTLKPNGLNQYDAVSKSKQNIDVKGTITGTSPTVKVNNVPAKISGTSYTAEDITLSSGGNILTATATNAGGTGTATSSVTLDTVADKLFTYDGNGSLTRSTFGAKQVDYTYDYENRVSRIVIASSPTASEAIYKYDYLGRRIEKNINGTITKYIYDGDNIIAEYNGNGILIAKYIYGPNIDEPIKGLSPTGTVPEYYYHFDGLGSVTDLSNSSGAQVEHYYYNPFGKTKIYNASGVKLSDSAYGNYYRFTARQWDSESQLYFYRARYYDPNVGRFLQADPVGYSAGDTNLYRYCGNNGINLVDPRGLEGSKKTGRTGSMSYTFMRIFGLPTVLVSWHKKGDVDILFEYLDSLSNEEYEKLLQELGKLRNELLMTILLKDMGLGAFLAAGGVIAWPFSPVGGGLLIGTGIALEVKGVLEIKDWAERYGEIYNKIREQQEQF